MTPQARSLELLRSLGYLVSSVERRKRFPQKGQRPCPACGGMKMLDIAVDLWNVFDLIAVKVDTENTCETDVGRFHPPQVIFVQVTTDKNRADRRNKLLASGEAKICVLSGCRVLLQTWGKHGGRWVANDEWIELRNFVQNLPNTAHELYSRQLKGHTPKRGALVAPALFAVEEEEF